MRLIKNGINERNLSVGSKGGAAHRERQVPRGRRGHSKSRRRWPADASRLLHSFPEDSFVGAGLESPQSCTLPRLAVHWCDLGRHPVNRDHWARTQEWKIFFNVFQVNLCCGRLFFCMPSAIVFIEIYLIYKISGIQQCFSYVYIYVYPFSL